MLNSGFLKTKNNLEIYHQIHVPECSPKALITIVHGLTGHCENYKSFIEHFTSLGFAVIVFDLPGHGKSGGRKNHVHDYGEYRIVLNQIINLGRETFEGIPLFLLGHSVGGLISIDFLIEKPESVDGLILSGPSLTMKEPIPKRYLYTGMILSTLLPKVPLMKIRCMQKSQKANACLRSSEYISARFAMETLKTMKRVLISAQQISTPLIILHGEMDSVVSPDGSQTLYEEVQSTDKTLSIYPDISHEFLSDSQSPIIKEIENWLNQRAELAHCN